MKLSFDDNSDSISQLEAGIEQQQKIVENLRGLGEPTALADKFLTRLKDSLAARLERNLAKAAGEGEGPS